VKNYDFDVTITCRHDGCSEKQKNDAIDEVKGLSKYHTHIINAHITVEKQNSMSKIDIAVHVPGTVLTASTLEHNYQKAFDDSLEKVKIQLKKLRDKTTDHRASSDSIAIETE